MDKRTPDWARVGELLDQHFPVHTYSADDRINVLVFLLRTQGEMKMEWKKHAKKKQFYRPLQEALRRGDVRSFKESMGKKDAWEVMQLILRGANHRATKAELDSYVTLKSEFDRLYTLPFSIGVRVGVDDLRRRGYVVASTSSRPPGPLKPEDVHTLPELLTALNDHRLGRGKPSWRSMAKGSDAPCPGGRPEWHQPRSHTALRELLGPNSRPSLPAVLAFVRGCGGFSPQVESTWAQAHARALRSVEE